MVKGQKRSCCLVLKAEEEDGDDDVRDREDRIGLATVFIYTFRHGR